MKTKVLYSIILASAALTPLAAADELNQTISVTKETEVVEHKAEKMEALPDAAPSTVSRKTEIQRLGGAGCGKPVACGAESATAG